MNIRSISRSGSFWVKLQDLSFLGKNNKEEKEEDTGEILLFVQKSRLTTRHLRKNLALSWDIYDIFTKKKVTSGLSEAFNQDNF